MSISERMDNQIVIYSYHVTLFNNKKEQTTDIRHELVTESIEQKS